MSSYRGAWRYLAQSLATGSGATCPDVALCMHAKAARFRDSLREQPQDVGHTWPMGIEPTEEKRWCLMRTMQSTGADAVPSQFGDAASCCQSLAVSIE
ncbi:hypothetical protein N7519_006707 [Penicillium mononematosum]|uniref:uncharacterized protein n=1 Tax=Penicillium mononematosum TaxID=268346 RepID=UPI0025493B02|nr:uncharacterized protein N7519_006707 [Penicillium mononematosum]KAJ6185406.1 hypothetical protein N7519_006707 [Penicillium mononematosum]